jgi:hypothetical protein
LYFLLSKSQSWCCYSLRLENWLLTKP